MNYYQHHIGDFIRDTARLTDAQCMAYLRMIWMYYETEQPLECDVDALAFKTGANASDVHQIIKHFFFEHDGKWHHSRCDTEILAFREKSKKAKKSADARWKNANAMRTHECIENADACERMQTHANDVFSAQKIGREDANSMRTHSERNANEPFFDANQEPVTNISTTDVVDKKPREKSPAKKGAQIPHAFIPNGSGMAYAQQRGVNVDNEILSFGNYHRAKGSVMKDWQAAWRTWCDKAVEFGRTSSPKAQSLRDQQRAAAANSIFGSLLPTNNERIIEHEPHTPSLLG